MLGWARAAARALGARHQGRAACPGVSTLALVTGLALMALAVTVGVVQWRARDSVDRDTQRASDLALIATAQEFYFDHNHHYAALTELTEAHLLAALPHDPGTGQPYQLYRSQTASAWCTWAALERSPGTYLRRDERGSARLTKLPTSLTTCKD